MTSDASSVKCALPDPAARGALAPWVRYSIACYLSSCLQRRYEQGEALGCSDEAVHEALAELHAGTAGSKGLSRAAMTDPTLGWLRKHCPHFSQALSLGISVASGQVTYDPPTGGEREVSVGTEVLAIGQIVVSRAHQPPDRKPDLDAEFGCGRVGTSPEDWTWAAAWWSGRAESQSGVTDSYCASYYPRKPGEWGLLMRFRQRGEPEWTYVDERGYRRDHDAYPGNVRPLRLKVTAQSKG